MVEGTTVGERFDKMFKLNFYIGDSRFGRNTEVVVVPIRAK